MTPVLSHVEAMPPTSHNVCAVVVAYYPDSAFELRLRQILPQVARLVVIDNSQPPIALSSPLRSIWQDRIHCISNAANRGVAAALNQGLAYAKEQGYGWLLTLDQDTRGHDNMLAILQEVHTLSGLDPAIIGSNYYDPTNQRCKVASKGPAQWVEQKTVITSGCLVKVDVALRLGGFRGDFFIDQVDHEFCLRARVQGHRVVISRHPAMQHSVGAAGGVRLPILGVLPNHPPVRKYYIARNTVVTVAKYWRTEPVWCAIRMARLILGLCEMVTVEPQRFRKAKAFFRGISDALRGRMGPCREML